MDFEAMIRDAQKNGLTIDDIAKMFSKTLNTIQQEDQKKKTIKDARTKLIEQMKDQFATAVSKDHFSCTDAAALCTIVMAEKYPDCRSFAQRLPAEAGLPSRRSFHLQAVPCQA